MPNRWNRSNASRVVRACLARALPPGAKLPAATEDLAGTGLIDSMGWVAVLSAIAESSGIVNFGVDWPEDQTQSIEMLIDALVQAGAEAEQHTKGAQTTPAWMPGASMLLAGWGYVLGSELVLIEKVERECGLAPGSIGTGAGLQSLRCAKECENELVLGTQAAEAALGCAGLAPESLDFVVATSATYIGFPGLGATLHSALLLPESCGALDIGGGCVGLIQALAVARGLLESGPHRTALVVASEVNSRRLSQSAVPGNFRALFGDGACALVLVRAQEDNEQGKLRLGEFIWGCSGTAASSLQIRLHDSGAMEMKFRGEQLAGAAIATLERTLARLETLSGKERSQVAFFAVHEPNPRVIEILAQRTNLAIDKFPLISRHTGNLGSATCGVGLSASLAKLPSLSVDGARPLIFIAAVGPGLLWGGTYLS